MADTPPPSGWEPPPLPNEPPYQPPAAPPPASPPPAAPNPPPPSPGAPPPPAAYPNPSPYEPPPPAPPGSGGYPTTPAPPGGPQPFGGPGQPPPPPNQGWGPPPPPAKKSRKNLWITLGVIFGVLLLAIGGCAIWFVGAVTAPVDEANDFLALVDEGRYADAVATTDPGCNAGLVAADLDALLGGADITYNLNNSSITNSSATVMGSFSAEGQSWTRISLFLRNNDGWSVCGLEVNS